MAEWIDLCINHPSTTEHSSRNLISISQGVLLLSGPAAVSLIKRDTRIVTQEDSSGVASR